jgi:hypothetical protein
VEKNASEAALSKRDPTLPIDCTTPSRAAQFREILCRVG